MEGPLDQAIKGVCKRPDVVAFRRHVLALAAGGGGGEHDPLCREPRPSNLWQHAPLQEAAVAWSHRHARTYGLRDEAHQQLQLRRQQLAKQQQKQQQGATDISALALAEPVPAEALGNPADWVLLQGLLTGQDRCDMCMQLARSDEVSGTALAGKKGWMFAALPCLYCTS
jgi:hypothetical protein